jgi:ribosomal protein S18 acetylase RimI-like enzyme
MPQFTIRHLTPADAADFRAIRLAALQDTPDAFGSTYEFELPLPLSKFAERLTSSTVFGAYLGGRIVGMAGYWREEGSKGRHKGVIWGMYVAPEARRFGIGTALLEAIIESAIPVVEQLRLAVIEENAEAISLYQKHGFEIYGVEPRALKSPLGYSNEVMMVRHLSKVIE